MKRSEAQNLAFLSRWTSGLNASLALLRFFSPIPFTIHLARIDDLYLLSLNDLGLDFEMSENELEKDLEDEAELEEESESEFELELDLRERFFDLLCLAMLAIVEQKKI